MTAEQEGCAPSSELKKVCASELEASGIVHGFYTRIGGVSFGDYEALNCGFGSDDKRENVAENRRRIADDLGFAPSLIMTPYQHHSADTAIVTAPFEPEDAPKADALVTNKKGLLIGILTADCAPVLFMDAEAGVVGAAHAGWRGALGGVLERTVEVMEELGGQRARIKAAVGPCISLKNYEVGDEFQAEFISHNPGYQQFFNCPAEGARPHFNLPGFAKHRLDEAGVGEAVILPHCTYENESLFFSYRRNCHENKADYGREVSVIGLN